MSWLHSAGHYKVSLTGNMARECFHILKRMEDTWNSRHGKSVL